MKTAKAIQQHARGATEFLAASLRAPVRVGIVLGTGSGGVADQIDVEHEFAYDQIPNFPTSTAIGHKGCLLFGELAGQAVVAMNGRFHLYEGHDVGSATMAVRVMHQLGVRHLFITNAAGGVNPQLVCGDIVNIRSHIDLMCRISAVTNIGATQGRTNQRTDIYDTKLAADAHSISRANGFSIYDGVYAGLLGPNYESRAEYRMLRRIGADVAGMSTIPEVYVAAQLQMKVLAMSVITNVASPDSLTPTSGHAVIESGQLAAPRIHSIIAGVIERLDTTSVK